MATWDGLGTRRGQLQEIGATVARAKSMLQEVLEDYPEEACGSAWLEEAVGLAGRCEREIDNAAEVEAEHALDRADEPREVV